MALLKGEDVVECRTKSANGARLFSIFAAPTTDLPIFQKIAVSQYSCSDKVINPNLFLFLFVMYLSILE